MAFPFFQDYSNLPLLPAWYIPGWTSQNDAYQEAPNPTEFANVNFPTLNYTLVTGEEFDFDGNPLGGYFQFMPSDNISVVVNGVVNRLQRRYSGSDMFQGMGYNQAGSGRVYLFHGKLAVALLATDNAGIVTDSGNPLFYYVKEKFWGGQEYQISIPFATVGAGPVDIRYLVTPEPDMDEDNGITTISWPVVTTDYVTIDMTSRVTGGSLNNIANLITSSTVSFAFKQGSSEPQGIDWNTGAWAATAPPYLASILVGPQNSGLSLATGTYSIWVKVTTSTEVPVFRVGSLQLY